MHMTLVSTLCHAIIHKGWPPRCCNICLVYMYKIGNKGPGKETPFFTQHHLEAVPLATTLCNLLGMRNPATSLIVYHAVSYSIPLKSMRN